METRTKQVQGEASQAKAARTKDERQRIEASLRITKGPVFKKVFGDRPDLCRRLVEVVLGMEVAEVKIVQTERELSLAKEQRWRGGRIDLYVVDSEGNAYDVEMQASRHDNEWLRARHYQALMDATFLQRGGRVEDLPSSVVIFICDFDPFYMDLRFYDCYTMCLQTGEIVPDRRRSVYLSATASGGDVSESLDAFLRYVSGDDVRGDPFVDEVRDMVHCCLEDEGWLEDFMTWDEYYENEVRQGAKRAFDEGRKQGYADGERQGYADGERQGKLDALADLVRDGTLDPEVAAARVGMSVEEMRRLAESGGDNGRAAWRDRREVTFA
ncbi:MAG: Rpn family recombination-promoting nuclease/putative transposase [Atopobiaceae bacterium]|nr:Rpn family recombination-promoting nuclease/putative transposase [Atopobiaceae bacterium]